MKKKFLLFILVFYSLISYAEAQLILEFSAKHNASHIALDSIYIKNVTKSCDTMLYFPDSILEIQTNVGINTNQPVNNNFLSQNYPNPFGEETSFSVFLQKNDFVTISIFDVLGRELTNYKSSLSAGTHLFTFYAGSENYYFVNVTTSQRKEGLKILHINNGIEPDCKLVYKGISYNSKERKSTKSTFIINTGDQLMYIGYSTITGGICGSDIITDSPLTSTNYLFQITNGVPCPGTPFVTDIDGNVYNTVQIGNQCWMKENLKVTKYNDSTEIPYPGTDITSWYAAVTTGAYAWYNDDSTYKNTYGALYNWNAVGSGKLCPPGWHVPTNTELLTLVSYLGGGSVAGGKMKETDTVHWNSPNTAANDSLGFSALPAGLRVPGGTYDDIGNYGRWWTSSPGTTWAWYWRLEYNTAILYDVGGNDKRFGQSVRCIKN